MHPIMLQSWRRYQDENPQSLWSYSNHWLQVPKDLLTSQTSTLQIISIMSLALKITRNPCCRQVLLPRSSTLCKVIRRNLATSHNPQLLGPSHHHTGLSALKPKPKSDALMYSAFAAAGVGIPCAILYSLGKESNRLSFSFQKRDRNLDSGKWFANDSSQLLKPAV